MALLSDFMVSARRPGGLLSDEGMTQLGGLLSALPSFSGRPNAAAPLASPLLRQAQQMRGRRLEEEQQAKVSEQVRSLVGNAQQELAGPTQTGAPLIAPPAGLLGGKLDPVGLFGGLMQIPGMEKIGAQGIIGLQQAQIQGGPKFGLTPFYFRGADGQLHAGQLTSSGGMQELPLPEGATVPEGMRTVDLGANVLGIGARTGQPLASFPKAVDPTARFSQEQQNVRQERQPVIEAEKVSTTAQAQAAVDLPKTLETAQQALDAINAAINHPGRTTATGASSLLDPRNFAPGTDARNFQVLADQIQGKVFLQAYESLKGGGQITEVEGLKAEQAQARLNRAQSDGEYLGALMELRDIVMRGMERARAQAGGAQATAIPPPPPGFQVVE